MELEKDETIVILEEAKKSAYKHNFKNRYTDVYESIIGLKIFLEELKNNRSLLEISIIYKNEIRFEISPESSSTLKIRRYRQKREFKIEGDTYLFEWHIKIGHETRIHFYVDKDKEKIYIGHCGQHLPIPSYNS